MQTLNALAGGVCVIAAPWQNMYGESMASGEMRAGLRLESARLLAAALTAAADLLAGSFLPPAPAAYHALFARTAPLVKGVMAIYLPGTACCFDPHLRAAEAEAAEAAQAVQDRAFSALAADVAATRAGVERLQALMEQAEQRAAERGQRAAERHEELERLVLGRLPPRRE